MRVTSNCANHPSREAVLKCRGCSKWLCDRCAEKIRGFVYCGPRCRARDIVQRSRTTFNRQLRRRVPAAWVGIIVAVAVIAAGASVVTLTARLVSLERGLVPPGDPSPYAEARLVRDGDDVDVEIRGSRDATAVLLVDGRPTTAIRLDRHGKGRVDGVELGGDSIVEIGTLSGPPESVAPLPTETPTATPTDSPTPTFTATATTTPTATAEPTRPPSPTAPAGPTAAPTAEPTRAPSSRRSTVAAVDRPDVSPPVLHLVTDAGPRIAITFDGNASSNGTAELLDLLEELDLEITLFVTGRFIERYPTLLRQAVLAGHEVGSHTFSHPHLTTYGDDRRHRLRPGIDRDFLHDQLRRTESAFRRATGRSMAPLWRAPFGEENSTLRGWALELGYLHVRWSSLGGKSLDSLDWIADEHSKLYRNSRRLVDRLLGFPRLEGGIVLMHLATERSDPPWSDLPRFVRELERRKIRRVKVSELLDASPTWRPWLDRARERHVDRVAGGD